MALKVSPFRGSLYAKLLAGFLLVVLIPLSLMVWLSIRAMRSSLTESAYVSLSASASRTSAVIDAFVTTNLTIIGTEAKLPVLASYLELPETERAEGTVGKEAQHALASFSKRDPIFIDSYALLDIQGHNLLDTNPADEPDEAKRPYFYQALEDALPYVSPVEFLPKNGQAYIYFSSPVNNASGVTIGLLRVRYNANVLQQRIAESSGLLGPASFALLVDDQRLLLGQGIGSDARSAPLLYSRLGALPPEKLRELTDARRAPLKQAEQFPEPELITALDRLSPDKPYFTSRLQSLGGRDAAFAVTSTRSRPWKVMYLQPNGVFLAPVESQSREFLYMALAFALIACATGMLAARSLSRPIARLTRSASELAAGKLETKIAVSSRGELGILESAFSRMAAEIQRLIGDLAHRNDELKLANDTLFRQNEQLEKDIVERMQTEVLLREQQESIRRLSTPILAVWPGVLALPVIGHVDEARAQQMMEGLLNEITQWQAEIAIIDLTGAVEVDTGTIDYLAKIAQAVQLLGGRCVLSGISPQVARSMATLDLGQHELKTFRTLKDALRYAIHHSSTAGVAPGARHRRP